MSVIRKKFDLPPPSSSEEQYEVHSDQGPQRKQNSSGEEGHMEIDERTGSYDDDMVQSDIVKESKDRPSHLREMYMNMDDDDDVDEDGPVIVPYEEVQACMDRSSSLTSNAIQSKTSGSHETNNLLEEKYPFLFAATIATQSKEDILMTCARILDEQSDVTLVREAAAYLEEIEANR